MNKPTPGPWGKRGIIDIISKKGIVICEMNIAGVDQLKVRNEVSANAHLIAAAPEMYDILEQICNAGNCDREDDIKALLARIEDTNE